MHSVGGCRFQPVLEALGLPNGTSELWCASNDCRRNCDSDRSVLEDNTGILDVCWLLSLSRLGERECWRRRRGCFFLPAVGNMVSRWL